MFDINGSEFLILIVIAIVVLGPERLPEYAAKLGQLVRNLRRLAEGAKDQLRDQMGPEFDEIDWKQYDPRQYDPRRIVREALMDEPASTGPDGYPDDHIDDGGGQRYDAPVYAPGDEPDGYLGRHARADDEPRPLRPGQRYDPTFTPFDLEAT